MNWRALAPRPDDLGRESATVVDARYGALRDRRPEVRASASPRSDRREVLRADPVLSNADLARRAFVTPQSMHAVLQELERFQFVVRRPHPQHRRVLQAELTEAGRRTLKSANNSVNAVEEQMLRKLSNPARSRLASALSSCIDSLTETPASSVARRPR